jgi:hypothetical protein
VLRRDAPVFDLVVAEVVEGLHESCRRRKGIADEDAGRLAGVLELGQQTIDRGPVVHHVDDDAVGERWQRQVGEPAERNGDNHDVRVGGEVVNVWGDSSGGDDAGDHRGLSAGPDSAIFTGWPALRARRAMAVPYLPAPKMPITSVGFILLLNGAAVGPREAAAGRWRARSEREEAEDRDEEGGEHEDGVDRHDPRLAAAKANRDGEQLEDD